MSDAGCWMQLVNDVRMLRKMLSYLLRYDAVTFYSFLETVRRSLGAQQHPSPWLYV